MLAFLRHHTHHAWLFVSQAEAWFQVPGEAEAWLLAASILLTLPASLCCLDTLYMHQKIGYRREMAWRV